MSEIDDAFEKIATLVAAFQRDEAHYKSPKYTEAQARKDFIDKFWTALGWDVNHDRQTNPYEQEVKVERGVMTGGSQRHADYAFYLAPNYHDVRFFVEAKKPFVDIGTAENYFQLIRYGWNSGTPLAASECYLWGIYQEAESRGYHFDAGKLGAKPRCRKIRVTDGQLEYELNHLKQKVKRREGAHYQKLRGVKEPKSHPVFKVVPGGIEDWERVG